MTDIMSAFGQANPDADVVRHGSYQIDFYWDGSLVPTQARPNLVEAFKDISDTIWNLDPEIFRKVGPHLFTDQDRMVVVKLQEQVVGISVSTRTLVDGRVVLFRRFTCMYAEHQGKGLYRAITTAKLRFEGHQQPEPFYLAWRTRNPLIWHTNAAMCSRVVPDVVKGTSDAELADLATATCRHVYPGATINPVTLAVTSVYPGNTGYRVQPRHSDAKFDARFGSHPALLNPHDALFCIGEVRKT